MEFEEDVPYTGYHIPVESTTLLELYTGLQ